MSITVKYFASIRELLGRSNDTLDADQSQTPHAIWQRLHGDRPLPDNVLVAVNMEYVGIDHQVRDGDEVAFFPPVTGG